LAAVTAPSDELLGVSCVPAKKCLTVGVDQNAFRGAGGPLAETAARSPIMEPWSIYPLSPIDCVAETFVRFTQLCSEDAASGSPDC
jgi:hypothetical protein